MGRPSYRQAQQQTQPNKLPSSEPGGKVANGDSAAGGVVGAAASAAIVDSAGDNADDLGVKDVVSAASGAAQADGILSIERAPRQLLTATYVTDCSAVYMRASCPGTEDTPFHASVRSELDIPGVGRHHRNIAIVAREQPVQCGGRAGGRFPDACKTWR